jgi:hypothetical protein
MPAPAHGRIPQKSLQVAMLRGRPKWLVRGITGLEILQVFDVSLGIARYMHVV